MTALLTALLALLGVWLIALVAMWIASRRHPELRLGEMLRLVPDTVRLLKRLLTSGSLPRGATVRVWLLLAYLLMPIDVVPDFIPVLGQLDDVLLIALTVRSVVRLSGLELVERHWPGTPVGLALLLRSAGLARRPSD